MCAAERGAGAIIRVPRKRKRRKKEFHGAETVEKRMRYERMLSGNREPAICRPTVPPDVPTPRVPARDMCPVGSVPADAGHILAQTALLLS